VRQIRIRYETYYKLYILIHFYSYIVGISYVTNFGAEMSDNTLKPCECGSIDDVKPVQFRNGWGKSANGFFSEVHYLCKVCRNKANGSWRHKEGVEC